MKKDEIKRQIGDNIRRWRERRGLNQEELGVLALRYPSTDDGRHAAQLKISKLERGFQEPKASELCQIARVLKIELVKLLSVDGNGRRMIG